MICCRSRQKNLNIRNATCGEVVKMDCSVKIPEEDIVLIEHLKANLRQRGIYVTKKQVIDESIKFALKNKDALVEKLQRSDNTREKTEHFLRRKARFDFGKNWMQEIDSSV